MKSEIINGRKIHFYKYKAGTTRNKLLIIQAFRGKRTASHSTFIAEGKSKEQLMPYLKRVV